MDDAGRGKDRAENNAHSELYDALQSLRVTVEDITFGEEHIETSSRAFERTIIQLHGDGYTGFGEDTSLSIEAHKRLRTERFPLPTDEHTVSTFVIAINTELHIADHTAQRGGTCNGQSRVQPRSGAQTVGTDAGRCSRSPIRTGDIRHESPTR